MMTSRLHIAEAIVRTRVTNDHAELVVAMIQESEEQNFPGAKKLQYTT